MKTRSTKSTQRTKVVNPGKLARIAMADVAFAVRSNAWGGLRMAGVPRSKYKRGDAVPRAFGSLGESVLYCGGSLEDALALAAGDVGERSRVAA